MSLDIDYSYNSHLHNFLTVYLNYETFDTVHVE